MNGRFFFEEGDRSLAGAANGEGRANRGRLHSLRTIVAVYRRRLLGWTFLFLLLSLIFYLARIVWTRRWETVPGLPGPPGDEGLPRRSDFVTEPASVLPSPAPAKRTPAPGNSLATKGREKKPAARRQPRARAPKPWWRKAEGWLLAVESAAVLFVVVGGIAVWMTLQDLNVAYRELHQADPRILPTVVSAANPLLPDLQLPVTDRVQAAPKLLPASGAMAAPPLPTPHPTATPAVQETLRAEGATAAIAPTPAPDYAQRLQIPAIGVDSHVFQSSDPRALKLGVAQFGYLTAPGQEGNLVLAGHNDTYGEIFRDLGELERGDEVTLFGSQHSYTYRVRDKLIVEPDEVWVMLPTSASTLTLITCHPYLIDTHRLVVFADLVE